MLASDEDGDGEDESEDLDSRFDEAVRIVSDTQRCSTSWLQRKMTIGYNRAAKIVETIGTARLRRSTERLRDREVLLPPP